MKGPLLSYQSSHKSFVPSSASSSRNHVVVDTLTTTCEHRLAPCQVTHHTTPDANPNVQHNERRSSSKRDSFLKRMSFSNRHNNRRMSSDHSDDHSHSATSSEERQHHRCPHNLLEAQMGMSSEAFHVADNAPTNKGGGRRRQQSWLTNHRLS